MAKIVNGSLVLDPEDKIEFVDHYNIKHAIFWDDILDGFITDGHLSADQFVGATNATKAARNPQPHDDSFVVPTVWVNSTTNLVYLLINNNPGNAVWKRLNMEGSGGDLDHRITINDGAHPSEVEPFDMWVQIDPE